MYTKIPVWVAFLVITTVSAGTAWFIDSQCKHLSRDIFTANSYMYTQVSYNQSKIAKQSATNTTRKSKPNRTATGVLPVETPSTPVTNQLTWGVFNGWRAADLAAFETKVAADVDMQAVFVHWGNENEFPTAVAAGLKPYNKALVIFWEAMDYNGPLTDQPRFSYDKILAGDWDTYITSFANTAKSYGGPVILIPFEEMNGDWYPWSGTKNNNSADKHIAAYRHVRDIFNAVGASNVRFGWAVNAASVPDTTTNSITRYYPGDAYVDYVGVNGFNFDNPWLSFDQIFSKTLTALSQYNKPVYIFSMASAQGPQKAAWITDAMAQMPKYTKLAGWIWFNENKEKDWRVWSDDASLAAFMAATD